MSEPAQGWYPDPSGTPPFALVERPFVDQLRHALRDTEPVGQQTSPSRPQRGRSTPRQATPGRADRRRPRSQGRGLGSSGHQGSPPAHRQTRGHPLPHDGNWLSTLPQAHPNCRGHPGLVDGEHQRDQHPGRPPRSTPPLTGRWPAPPPGSWSSLSSASSCSRGPTWATPTRSTRMPRRKHGTHKRNATGLNPRSTTSTARSRRPSSEHRPRSPARHNRRRRHPGRHLHRPVRRRRRNQRVAHTRGRDLHIPGRTGPVR